MSGIWVLLVYGSALAGALLVLYAFHSKAWYWHVASIAVALGIGLVPPPASVSGPQMDLLAGFLVLFLLAWGIGGLFMFRKHHPKHA